MIIMASSSSDHRLSFPDTFTRTIESEAGKRLERREKMLLLFCSLILVLFFHSLCLLFAHFGQLVLSFFLVLFLVSLISLSPSPPACLPACSVICLHFHLPLSLRARLTGRGQRAVAVTRTGISGAHFCLSCLISYISQAKLYIIIKHILWIRRPVSCPSVPQFRC